jgi:hypothetical protein
MILPTALGSIEKADVPALTEQKKLARTSTRNADLDIGHHKTPSEVTMCAHILEFNSWEFL